MKGTRTEEADDTCRWHVVVVRPQILPKMLIVVCSEGLVFDTGGAAAGRRHVCRH
jgi:hypothetical protein